MVKIYPVKQKLFVIIFFIACLNIVAQNLKKQEEYIFRHIRIEDGLSQSSVMCMLQDKLGFLWFGTANGLNRYDGYSFKVFFNDPSDSTSISDNGILSIYEDSKGFIWIGTIEGVLNRYDRRSGIFKRYNITSELKVDKDLEKNNFDFPLPLSRHNEKSITSITEDKKGNIWFGTWGKGLVKLNILNNKIEHFSITKEKENSFQSNKIRALLSDTNGSIWVGTFGSGLFRINEKSVTNFTYKENNPQSLSSNSPTTILKDNFGNLWIIAYGGGLCMISAADKELPKDKVNFFRYDFSEFPDFKQKFSLTMLQDSEGNIWIGSIGGGLYKFNVSTNQIINFKNNPEDDTSISKNEILSILQDRSGNYWFGTQLGKGISKLERITEKFRLVKKNTIRKAGLNDDVVWSVSADDESRVWIGTFKGGLNLFDRKNKTVSYIKSGDKSISDNHIRAICDDGKGSLLIGTYSGGLNIFDKNTRAVRVFKNNADDPNSIGANQVQSLLIDKEGNYWIGTFGGGLNKVSKEKIKNSTISFERFTVNQNDPFSISDNRVYSIYEDSKGILWIGTFGGGLNKYDKVNNKFIAYKNLPGDQASLSDNRVMTIHEDKSNNLWIGTYGGGLNLFDRRKETFQRFNDKSRLNSSVVYGILEDNFNHLWMSTDNGLFKFDLPTHQFTQYDQNDGLQNLEFSGGAYFKSKSGEMFFGGIEGLNYFYPDSVIDNSYVPPIVISSIRIFDEPLRIERDTIELSYDQNFFSFEFAALDFTNSKDNKYAFMLEGFDKKWRFVDSRRRIANYTNLSPGKYVFSVIGSNNDGVWNYDGKNIYIKILPPFWKRWWFILFVVSLSVAFVYYIVSARYRSMFAIEKIKSKLSADLHDNVGSGLTEISILSELSAHELKNITGNVSHNLSAISEKARQLIDSMSDIVWMVNPQRDSFYDLIVRLKDSYSDLLMSSGISYKTINLEKLNNVKLPMEYKQNLFLIFKEALNNSIKHSKCKKISLEADISKDILTLILVDDGNGIEAERIDSGNGIRNMKARAKLLDGNLEIVSDGEGTLLKFTGKLKSTNKLSFLPFK